MDAAAKVAALFADELERGGKVADQAAGAITGAAGAVDRLEAAETEAAVAATRTAAALEDVGVAAQQSGDRASQGAQETAGALDVATEAAEGERAAIEATGAAAADAGREIETASARASKSVAEVTDEWQATIVAAKAAGVAFDDAAATGAVKDLAAAIRSSGDSLDEQKQALSGLADQLTEDLGAVKAASVGAGTATTDQANLIEDALQDVKAKIAEVDHGLREVGAAGTAGGEEAQRSFLSVGDALDLANQSARDAMTQLEETGRVPKAAIRELAEIIETVNIAMERTAVTSDAATGEQIQNVEELKSHLAGLTEITNRQVNASGDNAVALKETGDQVQGLTGALTGLIGVTGNSSTIFGTMVARIGQGASAFERAKDAVAALNISQISAGASAQTLGIQTLAVVGAIIAGATAGIAFAKTNKDNAEVMDGWTDKLKKFGATLGADFTSRLGAAQGAAQRLIEVGITNYFDRFNESIEDQDTAFENLMEWDAAILQFHKDLYEIVTTGTVAQKKSAEEIAKEAKARAELAAKILEHKMALETLLEQQKAASSATMAHVEQVITENEVTNGATIAIRDKVAAIAEDVAQSDVHSVALARTSAALQEVLDKTDGLTKIERARIQAVIDLAARGNELTAAEQRLAAELAKAIQEGRKAVDLTIARKGATDLLAGAVTALAAADSAATIAEQTRTDAIRTQLELVREQIEAEERRMGVARKDIQVNNDRGLSLDGLRQQEAALARELESSITVWHAADEAKTQEVETYAEMAAALTRQSQGYAGVKSAAGELHAVLENGQVVWTNVTTKADEAAAATMKVKTTTESLGVAIEGFKDRQVVMSGGLNALTSDAERLNIELEKVAENIRKVNDEAAKAAEGAES